MSPILNFVGPKLAEKRRSQNLSQSEIGLLIGLTQSAVSSLERGRVPRDLSILREYARVVGVCDFTRFLREIQDALRPVATIALQEFEKAGLSHE